jgi:hypothetical protein
MAANYVTFKKYPDSGQAKQLQQFLLENGIECLYIDDSSGLDSSFSSELLKEYEVQLHPDNFEEAEKLLENYAAGMLTELPEDYYMLTFTDEELHDVIVKQDEWSEFDYMLARKLLTERGNILTDAELKELRDKRIAELAKPEKDQKIWIVAGYITSFLGGFFGILIGYVLMTSHKTLPNGQVVHTYSTTDRKHGKTMLVLGLIVIPTTIAIRLLTK